jgi:hypothetical protein
VDVAEVYRSIHYCNVVLGYFPRKKVFAIRKKCVSFKVQIQKGVGYVYLYSKFIFTNK